MPLPRLARCVGVLLLLALSGSLQGCFDGSSGRPYPPARDNYEGNYDKRQGRSGRPPADSMVPDDHSAYRNVPQPARPNVQVVQTYGGQAGYSGEYAVAGVNSDGHGNFARSGAPGQGGYMAGTGFVHYSAPVGPYGTGPYGYPNQGYGRQGDMNGRNKRLEFCGNGYKVRRVSEDHQDRILRKLEKADPPFVCDDVLLEGKSGKGDVYCCCPEEEIKTGRFQSVDFWNKQPKGVRDGCSAILFATSRNKYFGNRKEFQGQQNLYVHTGSSTESHIVGETDQEVNVVQAGSNELHTHKGQASLVSVDEHDASRHASGGDGDTEPTKLSVDATVRHATPHSVKASSQTEYSAKMED